MSEHIFYYLASASPRRRMLAETLGVAFDTLTPDINECRIDGESPRDYVARISEQKAWAGLTQIKRLQLPSKPVLAADTIVVLDNQIIGKPATKQDARNMLAMLSGRTHAVLTQVTFASEGSIRSILSCNEVTFCVLSIQEIERYVARGESLDKAGGYGLQGFAASYVSHLSGSYTGVVGLPLFETACLFREFGLLPI